MAKSLSDRQQRLVFGVIVVILVAFGIYLSIGGFGGGGDGEQKSDQQAQDSDGGGGPATKAPSPMPTTDVDDANVVDWLPFKEDELKAAGTTAQGFAEAYGTIDYSKSPEEYYKSMEELSTKEFAKNLSQSSGAGAMWEEMSKKKAVAEGRADIEEIRSYDDRSITFTVKTQSITKDKSETKEDLGDFAVTVVKKDSEWRVYDFQPADAGDTGDTQ